MRYLRTFLFSAIALGFTAVSFPAQQIPPVAEDNEQPVRISTSLIQLDVVITDKNGDPIKDIKPDELSIFQDGKRQQIVGLSYVDSSEPSNNAILKRNIPKNERRITRPPSGISVNRGRVITFVLDDGNCLATLEGTARIRTSIKRFIDEQMLPDDKVAIYRTAGGASLMQMYTSNKEVLRRLTERLSFLPSRACGSAFETIRDNSTLKITGTGASSFEGSSDAENRRAIEAEERRNQVHGTMGVLTAVVERMKDAPQRKLVFFISEGILANFKDDSYDALRELADKAARSSVVFNPVNAKGLTIPGFISAQDEVLPGIISGVDQVAAGATAREEEERALSEGLAYLAEATGGTYVRNSNRIDTEIAKVLGSQAAYYLIAYEPEEGNFRGKSYHNIEVRVDRPDASIVSRNGFYGRSDTESQPVYKNPDSPLYQALGSAFVETALDLRFTLLTGSDSKSGSYIRPMVHIAGPDVAMAVGQDGHGKVSFDVVAVVLDQKGKVVEEFNRTYPITIPRQGVSIVREFGLDFSSDLAIKKPGVYTVRLAIRNNNSKMLGSAGDFVIVPDLKKRDLSVSSLVTGGSQLSNGQTLTIARPMNAAFGPVTSTSVPSVRRYRKGSPISYSYSIYNGSVNRASGKAFLTQEVRIFKEGREVQTIPEAPVEYLSISDPGRIDAVGSIQVNDMIDVGEYTLQIIVRDKLANKVAAQWIDFGVLN